MVSNFFEKFAKYEIDENDYKILKKIHSETKEPKQFITVAFRILPTGYELDKDTGDIVTYIMDNTIYTTEKMALDILKTLQSNTEYFRYIGTLQNGGPSELCLSPLGVLKVYEIENMGIINYILKGLYFVYKREPAVRLTTIKNRPNTMLMDDFYNQLFKNGEIGFETFRNIFYGLKDLGYIEGTGGIETLQANDLKLTGLGVKYVETYLNKKAETEVRPEETTNNDIVKEDN